MSFTRISRFGGLVGLVAGALWLGVMALGAAFAAFLAVVKPTPMMNAAVLLFIPLYGTWLLFLVGLVGLTARLTGAIGGWLRWGVALAGVVACARGRWAA